MWYLTVTLGPGRTTGGIVAAEQLEQVRGGIGNYRQVKAHLEDISAINRGLAAVTLIRCLAFALSPAFPAAIRPCESRRHPCVGRGGVL